MRAMKWPGHSPGHRFLGGRGTQRRGNIVVALWIVSLLLTGVGAWILGYLDGYEEGYYQDRQVWNLLYKEAGDGRVQCRYPEARLKMPRP